MSDEPGGGGVVELGDVDERLLWILRRAGDEWGLAGVAHAAALLAAPEPKPRLYVNHPRTEPVLGDVVRNADDATETKSWVALGNPAAHHFTWMSNGCVFSARSMLPARLLLLVDGETGQVVPPEGAGDDTDLTAEEVGALIDSGAPAEQVVPYRPTRCWGFEDGADGFVVHAAHCPYVGRSWTSGSRCIDYAPWGDRSWPAWVTR